MRKKNIFSKAGDRITTSGDGVNAQVLMNSRRMRRESTPAEQLVWSRLRNRSLNNWKFRRQHPFADQFILDFYCIETKVAIELDGSVHHNNEAYAYDQQRTSLLNEYSVRVIRFTNDEVFFDLDGVCRKVVEFSC